MLKKFGSVVTNNFGLKVLSIIFAIIMWLVVVNIDDPKITKTFTTTVSITNESAISDMGKYYEVVDGKNTVTFAVSAKRSLIEDLSGSDFKAGFRLKYRRFIIPTRFRSLREISIWMSRSAIFRRSRLSLFQEIPVHRRVVLWWEVSAFLQTC